MAMGLAPNAWQAFFGAVAAASAALAGLFFVAISLHPNEIASHPVLRYKARANLQKHTPAGRFGVADDLARTAAWLCGPGARFVTGIVVPVDGAFSAFSGV
jgi:NAD(P)-dependent dehydrogenase (short-subunit alcohol dehydrogenase family)